MRKKVAHDDGLGCDGAGDGDEDMPKANCE